MLNAVTTGITSVIGWVGTVVTQLTGAEGQLKDLLPLFAIGISISAILLGRWPRVKGSNSVENSRSQYRAEAVFCQV